MQEIENPSKSCIGCTSVGPGTNLQKMQKFPTVTRPLPADLHTVAEIAEIAGISKTSMERAFCAQPHRVAQIAEIAQIPGAWSSGTAGLTGHPSLEALLNSNTVSEHGIRVCRIGY